MIFMGIIETDSVLYRSGADILSNGDADFVLRTLDCWKKYAPQDRRQLERRIDNAGDAIKLAYTSAENFYRPVAVLETICIDTYGYLDIFAQTVGKNFNFLTGMGTWRTHEPLADTIVLVDFTIAKEMRGHEMEGQKISHRLITPSSTSTKRRTRPSRRKNWLVPGGRVRLFN